MQNHADVLIVGAGSAGMAAAVGAARSGVQVELLDRNAYPGGKATAAMVGTVCGLYYSSPEEEPKWAVGGFAREFADNLAKKSNSRPVQFHKRLHFLPYDIQSFKELSEELLKEHEVKVRYKTEVHAVATSNGFVENLRTDSGDTLGTSRTQFIDCSGESVLSFLAGRDWVRAEENQAAARVFKLEGLSAMPADALPFALGMALRKGVSGGSLSEDLALLSVVQGSYRNGASYFKLPLSEEVTHDTAQRAAMLKSSEEQIKTVVAYLRTAYVAFAGARISEIAPEVGFRTGFSPLGQDTLSAEDVLKSRKHSEGVATGAWPIEFWRPGKQAEMQWLDDGESYHIPAGALTSARAKNLYFAGRNLSADALAQASARVMGTCLQTGYAAGVLAAYASLGKSRNEAIARIRKDLEINH
ncbi:MAG: FAD-dependent oxidoreductase [Cryomorphaceae bacterium]|nr:MAG: FAD-dependent oxidoreductase [Cryomorphaceae bacterium]